MEEKIIELKHVTQHYGGVHALKDIDFDLNRGEIHCLIGQNGCGKSTMIKVISGVIDVDEGSEVILDGRKSGGGSARQAMNNGVRVIYQDLSLFPNLTVAENIAFDRHVDKSVKGVSWTQIYQKAEEVIDRMHIELNLESLAEELSIADRQLVAIARALATNAKILIMDEPSAPLTSAEVESMFEVVELLRKQGVSIIYISHRLEEIYRLSDRIVVIRDGEYVKTLITKDSHVEELIQLMVGRELTESYPPRGDCIKEDDVLLELKDVTGNGDKNISLKVRRGEILGLGGLVGAGRTELAQMIFGAVPKTSGTMIFKGQEVDPKSPRQAIDLGIALVPEDRKRHGAMLGISIKNNINMPIYERNSKLSVIDAKKEKEIAEKYRDNMAIKTPSLNQLVKNLSGGNQQKVILGRWLAADSELIIFDEPTRGIDVGAKYEIYKLMNDLVEKEGKAILMISSEMEELMGMSDRIIVLAEGDMTGELSKAEFSQETIMAYASAANVEEV